METVLEMRGYVILSPFSVVKKTKQQQTGVCPNRTGSLNVSAALGMGRVSAVPVGCFIFTDAEKRWITLGLMD